jgi:hypothetical protein
VDRSGPAPALCRGVAKDRRISVEDAEMRHGRKSRSVLFDGYKRHVLTNLDTGLVPAVGITSANAPEANVSGDIASDLGAAGWQLSELHIDQAYLSSSLVRDRGPNLAIYCKAWRVRNTGGRFAKDQFTLDFGAGHLTCPAGVTMPFEPGKTVCFPKGTCAACQLHHQRQRAQRIGPSRRGRCRDPVLIPYGRTWRTIAEWTRLRSPLKSACAVPPPVSSARSTTEPI